MFTAAVSQPNEKIVRGERVDVVDIDINEYNRLRQLVTDHFGRF